MKPITITACPDDLDERSELFCLNRLTLDETRSFEKHLAKCPACLCEVFETDLVLDSLRLALHELAGPESGMLN